MKLLFFLLIISLSSFATADTVKKWIDKEGRVHYGDQKAAKHIKNSQTIKIEDTYDQQSFEEGVERNKEVEQFASELEKERVAEEEKRKQEEEKEKKSRPPVRSGGTAVVPNPVVRTLPIPGRPNRPVNRPIQLPAK